MKQCLQQNLEPVFCGLQVNQWLTWLEQAEEESEEEEDDE